MTDISFPRAPVGGADPRLLPHLEPGEAVLWQAAPEVQSANVTIGFLACGAAVLAGIGLLTGTAELVFPTLALAVGSSPLPGLGLIAFGVVILLSIWGDRGANWLYVLTDGRALILRGGKLFRSATPAELRDIRVSGSNVYWARERRTREGNSYRLIGFNGRRDAEGTRRLLESWREWQTSELNAEAARFTERMAEGRAGPDEGVTRVVHPGSGLTIDVPSGWTITVSQDLDGPLTLFGVTLLKRVIRPGAARPYGAGGDWNVLQVRAGMEAGLHMVIRQGALATTLDEILNDPWNERMGLEILQSTPDLRIGTFTGFSVARRLPAGGSVIGFGEVANPALSRMIWLGDGATSVEFAGLARADQPDVQRAVDAMVESLSQQ